MVLSICVQVGDEDRRAVVGYNVGRNLIVLIFQLCLCLQWFLVPYFFDRRPMLFGVIFEDFYLRVFNHAFRARS